MTSIIIEKWRKNYDKILSIYFNAWANGATKESNEWANECGVHKKVNLINKTCIGLQVGNIRLNRNRLHANILSLLYFESKLKYENKTHITK